MPHRKKQKYLLIKDLPKIERPRGELIKNMGKYERQQIEEAEKIIVKVLNSR